ncbi:MAG TPA: response regulator, partial [Myxococcaceae bacterium]|nr:response regulator [Myxococcaceae bacterium]
MGKKVSVLVVDDSHICRQLIREALSRDPDLEVVGTCANGQEALEAARQLRPQVITMDVEMPVMDGLTAVEHIMAEVPTPILMLTADPRQQAPELTCRALELGALALQIKPSIDAGLEAWNLSREVKLLSSVRVIRHIRSSQRRAPLTPHGTPAPLGMPYG